MREAPAGRRRLLAAALAFAGATACRHAASAAPARVRTGRRLTLDDAMRELELLRPGRDKLADDFTLPAPGGERFKLSDHRGKVVIVNFWATWCTPCLEEMPALERLWRRHREAGLLIVGVSLDTHASRVPPFAAEHGITFPVVVDARMQVAQQYGVRALPTTIVVDRRGQIRALALGPRVWDNDAAHSLVEALTR